jgi:hypothetical protein
MESDDDFKLNKRKAHNKADNKREVLVVKYPIRRTNTKKKFKASKVNMTNARKFIMDKKTIVEQEVHLPDIQSPAPIEPTTVYATEAEIQLAHYEDKIKFAARELIDLRILLQEKDTLLAEKEESVRLAHSMENIARKELKYSNDHILLLQSRINNLETYLHMSALEYEESTATICEQEATISELNARHLETTRNHNNAMRQLVASHQLKIDLLLEKLNSSHKDTKDVAEAILKMKELDTNLKMKELEAYDPLPEIKNLARYIRENYIWANPICSNSFIGPRLEMEPDDKQNELF